MAEQKRYVNVTATVEVMMELPIGEAITDLDFKIHLTDAMQYKKWFDLRNIRIISEYIE